MITIQAYVEDVKAQQEIAALAANYRAALMQIASANQADLVRSTCASEMRQIAKNALEEMDKG